MVKRVVVEKDVGGDVVASTSSTQQEPPQAPSAPQAPSEEVTSPEEPQMPDIPAPIVVEVVDPPPPKKKRVMSEAQLNNLKKAREARAAKRAAPTPTAEEPELCSSVRPPAETNVVVANEETPQPPSLTKPPPAAPAKAKQPKAKVDFVDAKIEKAKAITKKVQSTPIRKAPKQTSVDEKAMKENQRRIKEAQEAKKVEFDLKVAAAVKREMLKQKQADTEKYAEPEPEKEVVPTPSRSQKQFKYDTSDGPVYIQQSNHGDEFLDRLYQHAPAHLRRWT